MHQQENKILTDHLEMYLKAIYLLAEEHQVARVKDIATELSVNKSSVTGALKNLAEKGFVNYDPYSFVTLTDKGKEFAESILNRYEVLKRFLKDVMDLDEKLAHDNACRMEHVIDDELVYRLIDLSHVFVNTQSGKQIKDQLKKIKRKQSSSKNR